VLSGRAHGNAAIHVVAGPAAAACLQQGLALAPEQILVHHDLLSCGPLPPLHPLEEWRDVRASYLRSLDIEAPSTPFAEDRDLLTHCDRLRGTETITLWLGTGVAEQLLLIWVIALLREMGADAGKCRILQFAHDRGHEVVAVGVLSPSRFKDHPQPIAVDENAIRQATAAWEAVAAHEPDALLSFLTSDNHALPFLQRALSSLLYHYPDVRTGLNAWEDALLRSVRDDGPKATRAVGHTMAHDMEFPEWMPDSYLFERLHRHSDKGLPRPLLTLSGNTTRLRETEVRLTENGEALLAGNGNAVEWNGIDDWVAGVHLDSRAGRVWFRNGQTLVTGR
jgi:hypothetical protein